MKKIFSIEGCVNRDSVLLFLRITIGSLMLVHGVPKLYQLISGVPIKFVSVMGMGAELSLALTVFAEVACSIFILVGFVTRAAVIPLIITMLVAVFYVHAGDPFIKQEMGLHYLIVYAVLLVAGSGKYSADYLVARKYQLAS